MVRKTYKQKQKKKYTRRRKQKGGALTVFICLFTEAEVDPKDLIATIEKTLGSTTPILDKDTLATNKMMFDVSPWGYTSLPEEEKEHLYMFTLSSPPAYLSKNSCDGDARLTRLEGEIGNALLADNLSYQLIPGPHGLYGDNTFFVGLRLGKSKHGPYDGYIRACK
jgi:hypothetical protein